MPNRKRASARRGVTLVEVLVVIGIIVLLVGMSLGAMMSVRKSARMTVCLNNLNQLGQLYFIYAAAHHDRIPLGTSATPDAPEYRTAANQFVWVNGAPSAAAGPMLGGLSIKEKEAAILFCPLEQDPQWRYDANSERIHQALDHQPVTIQISYAVRPLRVLWTHGAEPGSVKYPYPMAKLIRQHNYALMAEHPQVQPYAHVRSNGDAQINVLYADASVRPIFFKQFEKQYQQYIATGAGTNEASNMACINETDKGADTLWKVIDDN